MGMKVKKGHPGDDFGKALSNDPDLTDEQKEALARQRKLAPLIKANYLSIIGGEPPRHYKTIVSEINKGRWRISIYTTREAVATEAVATDAVTPSPRVTHGDVVLVDDEGEIQSVVPALSKGRHYPMSDVGMSGKKWC